MTVFVVAAAVRILIGPGHGTPDLRLDRNTKRREHSLTTLLLRNRVQIQQYGVETVHCELRPEVEMFVIQAAFRVARDIDGFDMRVRHTGKHGCPLHQWKQGLMTVFAAVQMRCVGDAPFVILKFTVEQHATALQPAAGCLNDGSGLLRSAEIVDDSDAGARQVSHGKAVRDPRHAVWRQLRPNKPVSMKSTPPPGAPQQVH